VDHSWTKLRARDGFETLRLALLGCVKTKAVDLVSEVARREVAIDFRRDARVLVAQDALDGGGVGRIAGRCIACERLRADRWS